jgi:GINS complex subunit 3
VRHCGHTAKKKTHQLKQRSLHFEKMSAYYDIDSILCEEERLPTTFATDAIGLGFLDPSSCEEDLKQDTKIELPLWLAKSLDAKNMVHLEKPKYFGTKFMLHLSADPSVVNIREKSPFFFKVSGTPTLFVS